MLEIFIALLIGILIGIVAGLLPGLHPNNTVPIILGLSFLFDPLTASIILITSGVINCFINFIPSIILGAPEDSTVLSVLPGHKMLLEGRGFEAIKLSVTGALGGILFAILILPLFALTIPFVYNLIRPYLHWLLTSVVCYMLFKEKGIKNKIYGTIVFLFSGLLGFIVLDFSDTTIFPLLSGLFGLSTLLISIQSKTKLPEKLDIKEGVMKFKNLISSIGIGSLAGIIAGLLPGLGSAQSTVLAQQALRKEETERNFLTSIGAVTTSDLIYSILALWLIGNPRSGIAVGVSKLLTITFTHVLIFIVIILISAAVGTYLTLKLSKASLKFLRKFDYSNLCFWIFILICCLIVIFSGPLGLLIAFVSIIIGLIPNYTGIRRTHAMGCLILPTILWFSGVSLF